MTVAFLSTEFQVMQTDKKIIVLRTNTLYENFYGTLLIDQT